MLEETQLKDRRSVTLSIEEFLQLLVAFNKRGIHFCNIIAADAKLQNEMEEEGENNPFDSKREMNFCMSCNLLECKVIIMKRVFQ